MQDLEVVFFNYIDWTTEESPRPFYVGKGKLARVQKRERNVYWQNIATKYGWRREVVLATKDEQFVFEEEKRRILELGTFEAGLTGKWGANLTEGGEGQSGRTGIMSSRFGKRHSQETLEKCRYASTGSNNPNFGRSKSQETLHKMQNNAWLRGVRGKEHPTYGKRWFDTEEGKINFKKRNSGSNSHMYGRKPSEETIMKRCLKNSGENNSSAKLTWNLVNEIRRRYASENVTQRILAVEYNVSQSTISNIIRCQIW